MTEASDLAVVKSDVGLPAINIGALIDKAMDSKAAVEVVKELRAMWLEDLARKAESEFDAAMSLFQSKCKPIEKIKKGAVSDYAPLEYVEECIKSLKEECGFNHSFDTDEATQKGTVIILCIVSHIGGHKRTSRAFMPMPEKTRAMNDSQQYRAAITYGKRTALENAYGLVIRGEDKDGNADKPKPPGPSAKSPNDPALKPLALELWRLLKPVRGTAEDWTVANQWLWEREILDGAIPEEAPKLTPARFREVILAVRSLGNLV